MRDKDWNGFTPDDDSGESHEDVTNPSRDSREVLTSPHAHGPDLYDPTFCAACRDGNPEANPKQTDSTLPSILLTNPYPRDEPALRLAWYEGAMSALGFLATQNIARLDAVLERRSA